MEMEKVIKGLEECAGNGNCTECQYGKEKQTLSCKKLLADALKLLKEQEAVKSKPGHWIDTTKAIGFPRVQCSVCGSEQGAAWMYYCPNCGAKMEGW